jgi:hypothetical protein
MTARDTIDIIPYIKTGQVSGIGGLPFTEHQFEVHQLGGLADELPGKQNCHF